MYIGKLVFAQVMEHLPMKAFHRCVKHYVYVLVAIIKKRLGLDLSLYTILQILSVSIFEKTPLTELFSQTDYKNPQPPCSNQLLLFD